MSAIQSVGSPHMGALQQRLHHGAQAAPLAGPPPQVQGRFHSLAESAGLDPSRLGDLKEQIRVAVDAVRGDDGSIERTAVKDALKGVLNDNGIDPAQLRSQLQSMFQQAGLPPAARLQGPVGAGDAGSAQQNLLDALGADDGAEGTAGDTVSLVHLLENLPKGSLLNTVA